MAGLFYNKNNTRMSKETINIDELKEKFGELKEITINGMTAFFRKPDMKIWRFALKVIDKSQTEFKKVMAVNCFVAGDVRLKESPYIEDVAEVINEFVDYTDAEVVKDGNGYRITVMDKSAKLRPLTIEFQTNAERNNPDNIPFKSQQNLLDLLWIEGDTELKDSTKLDYHMPALRVVKDLREKHIVSVKNA